jgi:two-component system, NarL family, nitrate/nitrite response regulator NarL
MPKPIRVVVIDPHPIFRKGVIATLQRSEELMLVGEGATVDDARRILRDKAPEALMLEVAIAEGLEVAEDVVKSGAKCVVLTALDDVLSVSTALNVGVSGYIQRVGGRRAATSMRLVS